MGAAQSQKPAAEGSPQHRSDSEGNFETPEAETPTCSPLKEFCEPPPGSPEPEAGTQEPRGHGDLLVGAARRDSSPGKHPKDEAQPETGAPRASSDAAGETDPEDSSLTQPPAETQPPATRERGMSGGDPVDADAGLQADALAQECSPSWDQLGKGKPPSLGRKAEESTEETPVPRASYPFDPEQYDEGVNPFVAGGCRLQGSPPASPRRLPRPGGSPGEPGGDPEPQGQVPKPEVDVTEQGESAEARRATPRKGSRIPASKLTPKRHREPPRRPAEDAERGPTEPPPPRGSPRLGPELWDSADLNPLGASSALQNSPALSKGSYQFDPNNFDSVDPFKPTKTLASSAADSCPTAENSLNEILESQTLEVQDDLVKGRDSPKKPKSRLITSGCKVKQYETQALALDVGAQDGGALISEIPGIANRDGRATDEEKLASTTAVQKPAGLEKKGEPEDDLEYFECSNVPVPAAKHGLEAGFEKEISKQLEKDGPGIFPGSPGLCSVDKPPAAVTSTRSDSPLDGICLSASEKTAVLTLIREEIITKEIEANEWKKKYEESRQEVLEMRKIVAEYEKTIAQMIEDEQRTNMTSQKNLQQLTMEKDQALADLNSVERSLSDLFRRYENLKGVLEGFKKNEEALKKCAQDYLTRVKQEEQRYQALKVHAEEKLDKANEEIAQVRAKAKAESAALHAGLRREQMKVESLERALQQKNQEIEELTKICDELIAKLGKTD
ncbi:transforming acidic coiled-coil-containing protein 1 isoform X1 [Nyctibius grandis]|uniref:transforming acidic coiled-coil-containing protein 1 isoform X1 n=1 Tax=Nyctibius grandis TaxID=48427 RepID=UPI0035BC4F32